MENSIYSGREALLLWCQQQTYKYVPKVSIKDFTTSWQDGKKKKTVKKEKFF